MEAKEAIEQITAELAKLQSSGQEVVPISSLITYLNQVAQNAPISLQTRQLKHLSDLEAYKALAEVRLELFKAAISTAQTALKMTLLVNGGAALAVLAFLGNIVSKADQTAITQLPMLHRLSPALMSFSIGVCLGAVAAGTTYLSQSSFHYRWEKTGYSFRVVSITLVVLSYLAFACGIVISNKAFSN